MLGLAKKKILKLGGRNLKSHLVQALAWMQVVLSLNYPWKILIQQRAVIIDPISWLCTMEFGRKVFISLSIQGMWKVLKGTPEWSQLLLEKTDLFIIIPTCKWCSATPGQGIHVCTKTGYLKWSGRASDHVESTEPATWSSDEYTSLETERSSLSVDITHSCNAVYQHLDFGSLEQR